MENRRDTTSAGVARRLNHAVEHGQSLFLDPVETIILAGILRDNRISALLLEMRNADTETIVTPNPGQSYSTTFTWTPAS